MKRITNYDFKFYNLTKEFLKHKLIENYLRHLRFLQAQIRHEYHADMESKLCLRLYEDDTLITDIESIKSDFFGYNREYILKELKECVENESVRMFLS